MLKLYKIKITNPAFWTYLLIGNGYCHGDSLLDIYEDDYIVSYENAEDLSDLDLYEETAEYKSKEEFNDFFRTIYPEELI